MAKKKKDDAEATSDDAAAEGGGGKGNKVVTAAAVGAFVLTGYNVFLKPAPTATVTETVVVEEAAPMDGAIHELEEMVINLSGNEGATFLRVGIAIVLTEEEDPALFAADEAIAKDVVIELLGAKRAEDLAAGPARQSVKQQLTDAMIEAYGEDRVIRALFTGLVMQ